jgi:glycosyltransferase involved in cell wall biosynthesis
VREKERQSLLFLKKKKQKDFWSRDGLREGAAFVSRAAASLRQRREQKFFGSFFQKRTKLLFVSHAAELGGAEYVLIDLASHLGPASCEILLFADGALRGALQRSGLRVHLMAAGNSLLGVRRDGDGMRVLLSLPATLALALRLAVFARRYRLIYANSQKAAAVSMLAGMLCRRPVVWHLHDSLDTAHFAFLQRRALAMASRVLARAVVAVSDAARRAYLDSGGSARRVRVVHNGIDPHPFEGLGDKARDALRAELGLPPGRLVGLFGRIAPWKGQRVLIEALALLPGVRALIVGAPLFGAAEEEASLKDLARRRGVADRVDFLGHRGDAPLLMRAVDLVLHCSIAPEPFGRVIVEAIMAGTPVLAADGGASREILGEMEDWLVRPGDARALADKAAGMFGKDEAVLAGELARLRARMERAFSLDRMTSRMEAILGETG